MIGSLIILWAQVEQRLAVEIAALHEPGNEPVPTGLKPKLDAWKAAHGAVEGTSPEHGKVVALIFEELSGALRVRNGVCHGLRAWAVRREGNDDLGIIFTLDGKEVWVGYHRLSIFVNILGIAWSQLGRMTDAAKRPGPGVENIYADITAQFGQRLGQSKTTH